MAWCVDTCEQPKRVHVFICKHNDILQKHSVVQQFPQRACIAIESKSIKTHMRLYFNNPIDTYPNQLLNLFTKTHLPKFGVKISLKFILFKNWQAWVGELMRKLIALFG